MFVIKVIYSGHTFRMAVKELTTLSFCDHPQVCLLWPHTNLHAPFSGTTNHESPRLRSTLRGFASERDMKSAMLRHNLEWRCISPPNLPIRRSDHRCFMRRPFIGMRLHMSDIENLLLCRPRQISSATNGTPRSWLTLLRRLAGAGLTHCYFFGRALASIC